MSVKIPRNKVDFSFINEKLEKRIVKGTEDPRRGQAYGEIICIKISL